MFSTKTWKGLNYRSFATPHAGVMCSVPEIRVCMPQFAGQPLWTQQLRMISISVVSPPIAQRVSCPESVIKSQSIWNSRRLSSLMRRSRTTSRWYITGLKFSRMRFRKEGQKQRTKISRKEIQAHMATAGMSTTPNQTHTFIFWVCTCSITIALSSNVFVFAVCKKLYDKALIATSPRWWCDWF